MCDPVYWLTSRILQMKRSKIRITCCSSSFLMMLWPGLRFYEIENESRLTQCHKKKISLGLLFIVIFVAHEVPRARILHHNKWFIYTSGDCAMAWPPIIFTGLVFQNFTTVFWQTHGKCFLWLGESIEWYLNPHIIYMIEIEMRTQIFLAPTLLGALFDWVQGPTILDYAVRLDGFQDWRVEGLM